mgnify:CR=1 FL=1
MKIKLTLDSEASPIFKRMAREGNLPPAELALVACLNLIAIWMRDHGEIETLSDGLEIKKPPEQQASKV